jgi:SagB-type dehydrogenase family enzyme
MKKLFLICALLLANQVYAEDIKLKPINIDANDTLMQAIQNRSSSRDYTASKTIPEDVLSELLWVAAGINRKDQNKRTVPSALNKQAIDVYYIDAKGAYLYDPASHSLILKNAGDFRKDAGRQPFVENAAANLIYVADYSKYLPEVAERPAQERLAAMDSAFGAENVYLYAAKVGLKTVVRGSIDPERLSKVLKLKDSQQAMLGQCVGY